MVLVITGVGKVSAALAAQHAFDAFAPRCALMFGLAGATRSGAQAGELIIATAALQYDLDARPLTAARGTIPALGLGAIPADPALFEALRRAAVSVIGQGGRIRSGLILTGDRIVTSREIRDGVLANFPNGACFDMETAAVAQVARQNGVPWAALRMTSDAADETFRLDDVIRFGVATAAGVFERIIRAALAKS